MLYELRITSVWGFEFTQLEVVKETPNQYKVKGSKCYRSTINKSEINRVLKGTLVNDYIVWFDDLNNLPQLKQQIIEKLKEGLDQLLLKAEQMEEQIELVEKFEVKTDEV